MSYRNHLIRKHNVTRIQLGEPNPTLNNNENEEDDVLVNVDVDLEPQALRRTNALSLLKFKEKGRVPQIMIDSFVDITTQIVKNSV